MNSQFQHAIGRRVAQQTMMLEWIDSVGLLPREADGNVLASFPPAIRRSIIAEVTNCMFQSGTVAGMSGGAADGETGLASLTAPFHVRWVMEVVGQAFTLPLEDMNIVSNAAAIYMQWLLEPARRPPAVQRSSRDDQQLFLQTLFRHVSLLFAPKRVEGVGAAKPLLATLASKHVELCRLTLRTLAQAAASPESLLSKESWDVLLKVLLGVADSLLRLPVSPSVYLAEELGDGVLAMLTEHWLRAGRVPAGLWRALRALLPRWTHRPAVVAHWASLTHGLTQRVARVLYGAPHGTERVTYSAGSAHVVLTLEDDLAVDAWQHLVASLGAPERLPAHVFFRAVAGVERMAGVFLALPTDDGPATDTLLHVFGGWLFGAAARAEPECAEGRAQAVGVLCRVVVRLQPAGSAPVADAYLARFYAALEAALTGGDLAGLVFAVVGCEELYALGLPGCRAVLPAMVDAVRRLAPAMERPLRINIDASDLRRTCYKLLGAMHAMAAHYSSVPVRALVKGTGPSAEHSGPVHDHTSALRALYRPEALGACAADADSLGDVRFWIVDTLLAALGAEADGANLCYVLGALAAAVLDDAGSTPGLATLVSDALVRASLRCVPDGTWAPETAALAADALRQIGRACPLPEVAVAAPRVLEALSGLATALLPRTATIGAVTVALIDAADAWALQTADGGAYLSAAAGARTALVSLLHRAMVLGAASARRSDARPALPAGVPSQSASGPVRLPRRSLSSTSVSTASAPLPQPSSSSVFPPGALSASALRTPEAVLAAAAECLYARLVSVPGVPATNPRYPASLSSAPEPIPADARVYLVNGATLVAVCERPAPEGLDAPTVVEVVSRSAAGRASYAAALRLSEPESALPEPDDSTESQLCPVETDVPAVDIALSARFAADDKRVLNARVIGDLAHAQAQRTAAQLAQSLPPKLSAAAPPAQVTDDAALGRLFLVHAGLAAHPRTAAAVLADFRGPVRLSPCAELSADVEVLDALPERETFGVSVWCGAPAPPADLSAFVESLGWAVDTATHVGFRGRAALQPELAPANLIYWADTDAEVVFSIIPYGVSPALSGKARTDAAEFLSAADTVCVVWASAGGPPGSEVAEIDAAMAALPSSLAAVFVVVVPAADAPGLYRIRIMVSASRVAALRGSPAEPAPATLLFGPLLDGMVVRREALGPLVRETALSAARYLAHVVQGLPRPMARRAAFLQHLSAKYRTMTSPAKYYNELMFPM